MRGMLSSFTALDETEASGTLDANYDATDQLEWNFYDRNEPPGFPPPHTEAFEK